ncbi:MAG: FAD:protein FMN transferase [Clostridium fessum]
MKLDGNTLTFLSPDTTIDLGSIAKGYIADRMKDYLTESGVESAIISYEAATYSVSVGAQTTSRSASGCRNRLPTMQRSLPI